jgi:hypothetical protein
VLFLTAKSHWQQQDIAAAPASSTEQQQCTRQQQQQLYAVTQLNLVASLHWSMIQPGTAIVKF